MSGKVHCVIMGGGRGTRLYPLTKLRCKPAVPLAGKYRLVDIPISNCINSGYNRIYLLSQFNTASLHRHVQDAYRFDRFGKGFVEILSAEQTEDGDDWYQGTADAVRRNLIHFGAQPDDVFVILSGDQLYRMDFSKMVEKHLAHQAEVTVAAKPVSLDEASGLGLLRVGENSRIVDFVEKPKDPEVIQRLVPPELKGTGDGSDRCLASMGIYVFSGASIMDALEGNTTDFGDMTSARGNLGAAGNGTRGVIVGGIEYPWATTVNTVEYITIQTTGNAADLLDLTQQSHRNACFSGAAS